MTFCLPNILTMSRLLLIPMVLWTRSQGLWTLSIILFLFSLATDYLDGFLARRWQQQTHCGSVFDPIADRIFAIVYFSYVGIEQSIPMWFCALVLVRNISQLSVVPVLIWWLKRSFKVRPKPFAKWVTSLTAIYLIIPLYTPDWQQLAIVQTVMYLLAFSELLILVTFWPRFLAIARFQHDTFE